MTDIFISYCKEDAVKAKLIASALEKQGWSVWWDPKIPTGKKYSDIIGKELESARCVIVLWSKLSVKSDWVIDEANEGKERGILFPLLIDHVKIPFGFGQIQTADLAEWNGDRTDPVFTGLMNDISSALHEAPKDASYKPAPGSTTRDEEETHDTTFTKAADAETDVLQEPVHQFAQPGKSSNFFKWGVVIAAVLIIAVVLILKRQPSSQEKSLQAQVTDSSHLMKDADSTAVSKKDSPLTATNNVVESQPQSVMKKDTVAHKKDEKVSSTVPLHTYSTFPNPVPQQFFRNHMNGLAYFDKILPTLKDCQSVFKGAYANTFYDWMMKQVSMHSSRSADTAKPKKYVAFKWGSFMSDGTNDEEGVKIQGAPYLQPGVKFYWVRYFENESDKYGLLYRYFTWVNGKWVLFPKPWYAFKK